MKRITNILALALVSLALVGSTSTPANAQLVLVDEVYRIVEVDRDNNRIGIANRDANPNVRQNWVYIDLDTRASYRVYISSAGAFRDKIVTGRQILNVAKGNLGQIMQVQGGRDWNGTIKAKTIHFKI